MVKPKRQRAPSKLIHRQTWQAASILLIAIVTSIVWNQYYEDELSIFWRHACRISKCHASLSSKGRTHVVKSTIPVGTLVAEIPRRFLITESDARRKLEISDGTTALAVYLAQLVRGDQHQVSKELQSYVDVLPKHFAYHPILWNSTLLTSTLGTDSLTRHRVDRLRHVIDQEYETVSKYANRTDYITARLNVLTRSFGSSNEHAMVPILDLYDHRGSPNVQFQYQKNAYQIISLKVLHPGDMLYDSYGKRTDSDLFSKYGFVNRDGDDWMDASLGIYHNVLGDSVDPKQILRYLQFDDGYDTCIYPANATEWEVKKQKLQDLINIATQETSWVVRHPPRADLPRRGLDAKGAFLTCEIITRTDSTSKLRTAMCIVRLVELAMQRLSVQTAAAIQSERETLQAVKIAAIRSVQDMNRSEAKMRVEPCPLQALIPLLANH